MLLSICSLRHYNKVMDGAGRSVARTPEEAVSGGEYDVRKARFREYGRMPHDLLLRRLFPPGADEQHP